MLKILQIFAFTWCIGHYCIYCNYNKPQRVFNVKSYGVKQTKTGIDSIDEQIKILLNSNDDDDTSHHSSFSRWYKHLLDVDSAKYIQCIYIPNDSAVIKNLKSIEIIGEKK